MSAEFVYFGFMHTVCAATAYGLYRAYCAYTEYREMKQMKDNFQSVTKVATKWLTTGVEAYKLCVAATNAKKLGNVQQSVYNISDDLSGAIYRITHALDTLNGKVEKLQQAGAT